MRNCTLEDAYKLFRLDQRARQLSPRTLEVYDWKLRQFFHWCETQSIVNFTELIPTHINTYLIHQVDSGLAEYFLHKGTPDATQPIFRNDDNGKTRLGRSRFFKVFGVKPCPPHRFRRTFALEMASVGVNIHMIAKLMGHKDMILLDSDDEPAYTVTLTQEVVQPAFTLQQDAPWAYVQADAEAEEELYQAIMQGFGIQCKRCQTTLDMDHPGIVHVLHEGDKTIVFALCDHCESLG